LEEQLFVGYIILSSSDTESANMIFKEERTIGEFKGLMCVAYICHFWSHEFNLVLVYRDGKECTFAREGDACTLQSKVMDSQ